MVWCAHIHFWRNINLYNWLGELPLSPEHEKSMLFAAHHHEDTVFALYALLRPSKTLQYSKVSTSPSQNKLSSWYSISQFLELHCILYIQKLPKWTRRKLYLSILKCNCNLDLNCDPPKVSCVQRWIFLEADVTIGYHDHQWINLAS